MKTDTQLHSDVAAELEWLPLASARNLSFVVRGGVVAVSGRVASCAQKTRVHAALSHLEGVKGILMNVRIVPPVSSLQADADLGWMIARLLEWSAETRGQPVESSVTNGQVVLRGEVGWNYQRQAAERTVSGLAGVVGVANFIRVRTAAAAADLSVKIEAALQRRADVDAQRIRVEVRSGRVRLAGFVRSCAERDAVCAVAWSAPGVCDVVEHLQVAAQGRPLKVTRAQHPRSAQSRAAATPVCAQP